MNYIKPALEGVDPEHRDRAWEIGRPLTPKSERPRATYGSLAISVQTVRGLCAVTPKCVRKDAHEGKCWPE
jgi:hypothetical protein